MPSDGRLANQEQYLKGKRLTLKKWTQLRPGWDHDHCEFCSAKFMAVDAPDILREGYATDDEYHWVCKRCFDDFKHAFGW